MTEMFSKLFNVRAATVTNEVQFLLLLSRMNLHQTDLRRLPSAGELQSFI